jgi:hypothetical protein
MGVPGDHLPLRGLGPGQAGARVEGPPVADRVLEAVEEPVREGAGLERLAVLATVDRPADPVPGSGARAEFLDVPEPDVVTVHALLSPLLLRCPLPGGAATRSARCAGPAPRRPAAALPPGRLPAGASGRTRPATPEARRSPHRSSAAGRRGCRVLRPGWRGAGRERLAFPGAARPWVRDDGRSAPPALSSPAPVRARPAGRNAHRGLAARREWEPRGTAEQVTRAGRPATADGLCLAGGPALPEGKAGRAGRGVPGGDRRPSPAVAGGSGGRPCCRPAGRAGLPPGTAGIHPRLCPPRQVRPARPGTRPGATRRTQRGPRWRVPARHAPLSRKRPPPAGSPMRACLPARSAPF